MALVLARYALTRDVRSLKQMETPGKPVPAARHGVLIMNLKSGGGKAEKFHLVDECRARGIEPVVLQRGDDLLQLARDAIDRGADVVGMAGGDGSQALVASIAAERGVPMVVIPAGTRNHFALDIGLDRDDVVGALDAYGEARERTIDLADVNGRDLRQQRLARPVRHHRAVAGVPGRQARDDAGRAAGDARTRRRTVRPALHRRRTAWSTTART